MEEKLAVIADYIGSCGMGVGITTLVALTLRYWIRFFIKEKEFEKELPKKI